MEVHFTPDLEAKLSRLATRQGRAAEALVQEAVERLVDYDDWFLQEVDKGLAAADRGEFVEHDAVIWFPAANGMIQKPFHELLPYAFSNWQKESSE